MISSPVVLIGELIVDVTLQTASAPTKVRMGGVFHACRGAWAIGADWQLGYFSPSYLVPDLAELMSSHAAKGAAKIGEITGAPSVMLIGDATESGPQGYEHLLRDHAEYSFDQGALKELTDCDAEILIIAGNFDLRSVLQVLADTELRVHVDIGSGPTMLEDLKALRRPLSTLFLSTSSPAFSALAPTLPDSIHQLVDKLAEKVILKENRGGARLFFRRSVVEVGSQRRATVHSVGVGDVFDVVYVTLAHDIGDEAALSYASWLAAEYAGTTFPADFRKAAERALMLKPQEILALPSIRLPWEARPSYPIYIAAPDFDYVNRAPIDQLVECLRYHNFSPRLPIRENGQANQNMSVAEKQRLFEADMALLSECSVLVAVNLFEDPGTMIEIGLAAAAGKPTILYDPYAKAQNVMLTQLPEAVSESLEVIVTAVFDSISRVWSTQ